MAQPPSLAALAELLTYAGKATWPHKAELVRLLRCIKNDIVGHLQRKELVVSHGLLDCLHKILNSTADHDLQLHTAVMIGCLANAGSAFVPPISNSSLVAPLLHQLRRENKSPDSLVTASLAALNSLAHACALSLSHDSDWSCISAMLHESHMKTFVDILRKPLPSPQQSLHKALVAELIETCCIHAVKTSTLVKSGLFDAMASLLPDYSLDHDHTRPHLAAILNTLSSLVRGSPYRVHRLIFSPALRRFVSHTNHSQTLIPVDNLLPKLWAPLHKPPQANYPHSKIFSDQSINSLTSPFCVWLMHLARSHQDPLCRLAALRLLAFVNAALDVDVDSSSFVRAPNSRERERQIALFAVPIAVNLVQDALDPPSGQDFTVVKENACAVLAALIDSNAHLQKSALEAGAVKHVSQLFRSSFDPITPARPMWSANSQISHPTTPPTPSTTLGDDGLPPELLHQMKCRASALSALANIAEKDDANRKAVIESGIISNLIESLTPLTNDHLKTPSSKPGNTVDVLLAACQAAKAMSRSVSVLRTSLIDAGIAIPIFNLLNHDNLTVQIAATNVTCNLVLDFSPMRQDLVNAGVVQTLCDHAKSSRIELRQASLWALKHLVLNAPQSMKRTCLEELGTAWLIQAVYGNQPDMQTNAPPALGRYNAAGEKVDFLNAPQESSDMDLDWSESDNDDDGEIMLDHNGTLYQSSGIRTTLAPWNLKARLRSLREAEQNSAVKAKRNDMLVQEQALDFIRNLINGDDNIAMIDYLNDVIGPNQIYEMLQGKLKPVSTPSSSGYTLPRQTAIHTQSQTQQQNAVWQPPELINAALGVIVHLAGGSSKHRQQLIAQKELLAAWIPHFSHHDRRIRVASVWAVINLTWVENANDRDDAKQRAMELRVMGIDEKVRALANDSDLDTRERVKTAMRQIDELLEGGRYR